jgi:large subunit ribosomal protein L3
MIGFAKKIGMTRLFVDGKHRSVTAIQFGPNTVVQTKSLAKDGYSAVQVGGFQKTKSSSALTGHVKKHTGLDKNFLVMEEFRDVEISEDKKSFIISDFASGDLLDITGTTIGRGFAGVVKRYGFGGQPKSHGHDHERAAGSIGSRWPQRVDRGKKMAGHMGNVKKTLKHVEILAIDTENNLLFVNGSVQGANQAILKIRKVTK